MARRRHRRSWLSKVPKSKRACVVGKMRKGATRETALRGCKVKSR